jgi:AcrR family transcriptional regulator
MTASGSRKRLSATERRTQLIEIGRKVFAERGYEATSVEEIAERAGISKPIVYEHFGGKEGLYAVIVDREMELVIERISTAIGSGTPRERVEAASLAFLTYVKERPDGFAVLSRDSPNNVGLASLLADVGEKVGKIFAAEFKRAGYDPKAAPIYAQALIGMVSFVGQWWTEDRTTPVDEVASHIAALCWMGLRHLPRKPDRVKAIEPSG